MEITKISIISESGKLVPHQQTLFLLLIFDFYRCKVSYHDCIKYPYRPPGWLNVLVSWNLYIYHMFKIYSYYYYQLNRYKIGNIYINFLLFVNL